MVIEMENDVVVVLSCLMLAVIVVFLLIKYIYNHRLKQNAT